MSGSGKKRSNKWGLFELVAFECALARDERVEWEQLKEEDATFELDRDAVENEGRRSVALRWLKHRLEAAPEIKLAADTMMQSLKVAGQLLGAGGLLLGLAAATAALVYTGEEPINVSAFFSVFVLLQAVLAVGLVLVFFLPRSLREALAFGPIYRLGRWSLELIFSGLQTLSSRILSGQQRQDAAEWAGIARRSFTLHGGAVKWVVFVKLQAAAFCFNLGVLLALVIAVVFSDRAFGWQTTLQVEESAVFELVHGVSTPWAWQWGEGVGYPSEEQIAGNRIVLKDGIQALASQDLAAWWRFLALGIVCYGVLPRLLFYALGKWQVWASLARYDFRNASAERLLQRLSPKESRFDTEPVEQAGEDGEWLNTAEGASSGKPAMLRYFCSRELSEVFALEALSTALAARWNLARESVVPGVFQDGLMADAFERVEGEHEIALVFESWMPPIRELERQLRLLREASGDRLLIKLLLLGIPAEGEDVSLRPEKQYAEAWNSFVRRMGDPYLILENPAL
ncbi:DUF2868 domain-containing protein [Pelagicoccus mobilis]|uniref:DUF2868 domain-containing protein n=1 Tax=Pelagicoccus mobilis TaxID=415221 RepID=A0A934S1L8_9BACT|nr:DUF2868 domain-containing protein [Pelagicoccus mobilis]MBK1880691.1 DUF2868 domain-containing protein [Pelagicoccus mobilis]